jgi:hypothetical protein
MLMEQSAVSPLADWANFYVIIGSSAGALTGLQFVVITLIAEPRVGGGEGDIRAFGTPTVVHFCAALLISAIMTAPWHALAHTRFCIGMCGAAGVAYALRVIWHARKAAYSPDAEDWVWYVALPLVAYTALVTAAAVFWWHPISFPFVIAVAALLFLFVGIHNAWDAVTYIALQRRQEKSKDQK